MERRLKQCRDCTVIAAVFGHNRKELGNWQIFRGDFLNIILYFKKMLTCLGLFHEKATILCVVLICTVHVVI
jgi:hypothetical protein